MSFTVRVIAYGRPPRTTRTHHGCHGRTFSDAKIRYIQVKNTKEKICSERKRYGKSRKKANAHSTAVRIIGTSKNSVHATDQPPVKDENSMKVSSVAEYTAA